MSQVGRAWNCGGSPWATPANDVGDVAGDHVPHNVRDHKGKGTSNVVLWTLVSGLDFDVLEPSLEVGSRVIGEGVGKGDCRVSLRHGWWVGGWMDGWMDGWMKN